MTTLPLPLSWAAMAQSEEPEQVGESARRSKLHRRLIIALPAAIIIGLIAYGLAQPAPNEAMGSLPDFDLPLVKGGGSFTSEQLSGHPAVVNFWASWCIPCREEAPLLEAAWQRYRDEGVQFVGVAVLDSEEGATEFIEERGITYPTVLDFEQDLAAELDVYGLPHTFFVDAEGNLAREAGPVIGERGELDFLGPITERELTEQIERLLEGNQA
jgi:cytochrome c biogenesis protein CcmG/thiol:disulfide interchange protein DsbE